MSILTAQITDVPIGLLTVPGLMDEEGKFYVGVPQVAEQFQFPIKHASRDIKALLGKDFQFPKFKTKLNPKAINAIPLENFAKLIVAVANSGNIIAQQLRDDLIGLSLHQLFCDAFNVKFEQEQRQEFLKWRQITREDFHPILTDSIQRNLCPSSSKEWAKYIWEFQDKLGIDSKTRDSLPPAKLARLAIAQNTAAILLDTGMSWKQVLSKIAA